MNDAEPGLDENARLRRPVAQRQAPLRRPPLGMPAAMGTALNDALGSALGSGQSLGSGLGAAVRHGLDTGQALGEAAQTTAQGFVERGVHTAYQVIEEYMRRGQDAAQHLSPFRPGPGTGTASPGFAADAAGAWAQNLVGPLGQTASSIAVPWMQLVRAWTDGLSHLAPLARQAGVPPGAFGATGAPGMATGEAAPAPVAAPVAAAAAAGPRAKVTLEWMSVQPAEVAVSLEPGADLAALRAEWSAAGDPVAASPASVVLYCVPGHVHVRLTLSDPPLAGRHVAALVDNHGQTWGSVSVAIADVGADAPGAAPA